MKMQKINILKNKALVLYKNDQMPSHLAVKINSLKGNETLSYVETLKELSEKLIRVYGYYKKYPLDKKIANEIVDSTIRERFGDIIPIREERSS